MEKARILLVDDRPDKLLALKSVLEDLGIDLICADSGKEALRLLLKDDFALILLDVSMPEMDGFETASLIRQRKRTEHTPIIFITSINTNETHVTRGYSLGAVDYVFSPIQPEILRAKVGVFIELFKKNIQVKEQEELLRQQAERKLSVLESRIQILLDTLSVGVFRLSSEGRIVEANLASLRLLGFDSVEEAAAADLSSLGFCLGAERRFSKSEKNKLADCQWKRKDGTTVWLSVTQTVSSDEYGNQFIEGLLDDISSRKNVEMQLKQLNDHLEQKVFERTEALFVSQQLARRSERLASLGTLAAGIAHEINNPLNSILFSTDFALRRIDDSAVVKQTLHLIGDEARRCGKIVKGVLQFSRDEKQAKALHDLNSVVHSAIELARNYVKSPLLIEYHPDDEPQQILLNPTEIEQVVINLIQNSVEAAALDQVEVTVLISHTPTHAILTISDNGTGIPEDMQMKIFDPFYSTKMSKGGTGLGLSVAHGIITEHQGTIQLLSRKEPGACFQIELPLSMNQSQNSQDYSKQNGINSTI